MQPLQMNLNEPCNTSIKVLCVCLLVGRRTSHSAHREQVRPSDCTASVRNWIKTSANDLLKKDRGLYQMDAADLVLMACCLDVAEGCNKLPRRCDFTSAGTSSWMRSQKGEGRSCC